MPLTCSQTHQRTSEPFLAWGPHPWCHLFGSSLDLSHWDSLDPHTVECAFLDAGPLSVLVYTPLGKQPLSAAEDISGELNFRGFPYDTLRTEFRARLRSSWELCAPDASAFHHLLRQLRSPLLSLFIPRVSFGNYLPLLSGNLNVCYLYLGFYGALMSLHLHLLSL